MGNDFLEIFLDLKFRATTSNFHSTVLSGGGGLTNEPMKRLYNICY